MKNKKKVTKKVKSISSSKNKISKNILENKNNSNINNNINIQLEDRNVLAFNDIELNTLLYDDALMHDKRTFVQYYISLLKRSHLLIFSFYISNNNYNSHIIKMFLFFLFFAVHFAVNALFFDDKTMHKIMSNKGEFNFIYQIPLIIYSSIISGIINAIIKYLALTEKIILEIKGSKSVKDFKFKANNIFNTIKIKLILFFIITLFLLFFLMYYITCFCCIYINTQIHLIKDSFISFGLSLIYPFGLCLIPGIFRLTSLRVNNKDKKCIYDFSKFIQSLL